MPPAHVVVIDIAVVPTADDAFSAIGLHGQTGGGGQLIYARDPNNVVIPSAPGTQNRFVSFFSRPRDRDADNRFGPNGRIVIGGSYCSGAAPTFLPSEVNAFSVDLPPEFGRAGFVLRLALDLSTVSDPQFQLDSSSIVVAAAAPPNSITLFQTACSDALTGVEVASRNNDTHYFEFGVYGLVPEPPSAAAALLLAAVARYKRR